MKQPYVRIVATVSILCIALVGTVNLFAPEKFAAVRRRVLTYYASLVPHDATVAKPASPVTLPDIIRSVVAPTPTLIPTPPPRSYSRTDFTHYYQTWNNCGPATLATALSVLEVKTDQKTIAAAVKPDPDDKNVSLDELVQYTKQKTQIKTLYRFSGNLDLLKQLVSHRFVVILETWFEPHPNDGMGHFRVITGYDDDKKQFSLSDSYDGPKVTASYDQLEKDWKVYGYPYAVFYTATQEKELLTLVGSDADEKTSWQHLLERSEALLEVNKQDAFAWFMRGKAQVHLGKYSDAAKSFDAARNIGLPWRMLWYQFEIFDAYLATGRAADVITLTDANLRLAANLEESLYYRAKALEKQGETKEAEAAMTKITQLNPTYFQYHTK